MNPEHYVTVSNGQSMSPAYGPFNTDIEARSHVALVREFVQANDPNAADYEYGTFRVRSYGRKLGPGRLNNHLQSLTTMQCGGCSGNVQVSEVQLKTQDVAPCENCPAGVDLIHARAHSN